MRVIKEITKEKLLSKVSPYDIYAHYYPGKFKINKLCLSPFKAEKHPSFLVSTKFGNLYHKAFNTEHSGDCFNFVEQMFHLDYFDALDKIAKDFGLKEKDDTVYKQIISTIDKPSFIPRDIIRIQATTKPWEQSHRDYLAQGFLEPEDLNISSDTRAFAVKDYYINKVRQYLSSSEICIGYNLKNERGDWLKIYRPKARKEEKWRSSIPFDEMHGLGNISGCPKSITAKSVKDGAFLKKYIMPCVCVTQAEDSAAFSEDTIKYIDSNSKMNYLSWDNDEKGVRACKEVTEQTGWGYINPPKELLQHGVTDWFEMAAFYKTPHAVQDFFAKKGVI